MLVSTRGFEEENDYLSERMRMAFAFLRENDLAAIECGRHVIDGDNVFANVMEYETTPSEDKCFEAHRNYYDVQYIVSGEEFMEYAQLEGLTVSKEYDADADYALYESIAHPSIVVLRAGDFAIVAPEDAHKPGCSLNGSCHIKKVVVKVRK